MRIVFRASSDDLGRRDSSVGAKGWIQNRKLPEGIVECKGRRLAAATATGAEMAVGMDQFRIAMAHFATGVTVITGVGSDSRPVGLTANSVTSVSLDPPLLLVCMDSGSATLAAVRETGRFGVSVLRGDHEALARRFSEEVPGQRFRGIELRDSPSEVPVLAEALAWMNCRIERSVVVGDHDVLFGEVIECAAESLEGPLLFFRGEYRTISS